jgi:Beta-propeller repeat/Abnormal spindle-like microcephaly-assoc'd, ASPM-SPD-2-Hydin
VAALKGSRGSDLLHMKLSGRTATNRMVPLDKLPGKSNYILGNRPEDWRTDVANYREVSQTGVYPGIDVVYYGTQRNLEYDFAIAPGANPRVIRLAFEGARDLRTDSHGNLIVGLSAGAIRLQRPVAYQESNGGRKAIDVKYVLKDKRHVAFEVAQYDGGRKLIIDPVLSYSTYLGGSNIDGANSIAVAPDNTAFVAGGTFSSDFPTAHPLQPNVGGPNDFPQDAFVTKLSADGSTLLYSTYLGGKNQDVANGIAVDTFGNAYVTGTTLSPDFPVTPGSWNPECGGDGRCGASWNPGNLIVSNAFVSKLNVAGSGLVYSTFIGEYENVRGQAIAVDNNENAYITGQVGADITPTVPITPPNQPPPPFIVTASLASTAFQPTYGGGATDAFVAKLSASGNTVLYLTYLGGSNEEIGYGIAADSAGLAYITGVTYSTNLPVSGGALQTSAGGAGDALIAKFNTNGAGASSLIFSTYLGGNGLDQGNAIALDAFTGTGNIYVTGNSNSSPLLAKTGKGQGDAFVLKLSSSGALGYFTFLGGSLSDSGNGIAVDSTGNAYVTGSTVSVDFPVVGPVFQKSYGGGNADAFVTKFDPTGNTIVYSSYLGGTNTDVGNAIALDTSGSAYVAGQTCSQDFPLSNPEQPGPGGNCDAFISKVSTVGGIAVNPAGLVFQAQSLGVTSAAQTVTITNTNDTASVAISGITITGDFSETNNCPATIAAGAQCTIAATFHPTAAGIRKGSIMVVDNAAGSPQVVNLPGSTSSVTLSASNLSFGNQTVGITSAAQTVTVTNTGTTTLTISSIAASGDFSETTSCSTSLPAATNCVINVTYKPSAPGQSLGAVTINDSAPGSPQSILLSGTGVGQATDFTIAALPPSAVVPAGTSASFVLTVAPVGGFSQPVALSCGTLPKGVTCSFSPNPVATGGATSATTTLTVATALRTFVPPAGENTEPRGTIRNISPIWFIPMIAVLILTGIAVVRQRPGATVLGLGAFVLLVAAGCGGGSPAGVPAGTPAGAYQITVTATSGTLSHTTTLSLQVN